MKKRDVWRILVATLKGGSGKTMTTVLLAIALTQVGLKVLVICADGTNRGATRWTNRAETRGYPIPYEFRKWDHATHGPLTKYAQRMEVELDVDVVIIDTGGEKVDVFTHACIYAEYLISPIAPSEGELESIGPTYLTASVVSENGSPLIMSVLLTRSPKRGAGMAAESRAQLKMDKRDETGTPDAEMPWAVGAFVHTTEISRNLAYSDMHGHVPDDVGEYAELRDELLKIRDEVEATS